MKRYAIQYKIVANLSDLGSSEEFPSCVMYIGVPHAE
jgi:hypothetical protein